MIGEFIQEHMKLVLFIICVLFTILGAIGTDNAFKRKDCISYVCGGLVATFAGIGAIMIILVTIAEAIW